MVTAGAAVTEVIDLMSRKINGHNKLGPSGLPLPKRCYRGANSLRGHRARKPLLGRLIQWSFIVQEVVVMRKSTDSLGFSNAILGVTTPRGLRHFFRYIR